MFTAGLAADILFYSFSEWILYATDPTLPELGRYSRLVRECIPGFSLEFNSLGICSCINGGC
ncbi:MAG: hypothetical protein ACLTLQ_01560 [[Clostridium] scindens]